MEKKKKKKIDVLFWNTENEERTGSVCNKLLDLTDEYLWTCISAHSNTLTWSQESALKLLVAVFLLELN